MISSSHVITRAVDSGRVEICNSDGSVLCEIRFPNNSFQVVSRAAKLVRPIRGVRRIRGVILETGCPDKYTVFNCHGDFLWDGKCGDTFTFDKKFWVQGDKINITRWEIEEITG